MSLRLTPVSIALLVAGCDPPPAPPPADMPARTWQYYVAHSGEIDAMQAICRKWSASDTPAGSQPAVVTGNCRAAAFAKSQLQIAR
ncbi:MULTISPECIES: hypothetical protein [unclassified Sphingopyxis]|uniref:hypothetical protein n=1 Tax=unclassified Sphingopyxis TaxID=2614943 RepID=UPI0024AE4ECF|nr:MULTISPECIES: hypothetical protein [unclassified Sphingopyxis]